MQKCLYLGHVIQGFGKTCMDAEPVAPFNVLVALSLMNLHSTGLCCCFSSRCTRFTTQSSNTEITYRPYAPIILLMFSCHYAIFSYPSLTTFPQSLQQLRLVAVVNTLFYPPGFNLQYPYLSLTRNEGLDPSVALYSFQLCSSLRFPLFSAKSR